jgi:hypothetical protein
VRARHEFLQALDRIAPHFRQAAINDVLPLARWLAGTPILDDWGLHETAVLGWMAYDAFHTRIRRLEGYNANVATWSLDELGRERITHAELLTRFELARPRARPLVDALVALLAAHRLTETWILDIVFGTVLDWAHGEQASSMGGGYRWRAPSITRGAGYDAYRLENMPEFSFSAPAWNPLVQSRAEAEQRLNEAFERERDRYFAERETALSTSARFTPEPAPRELSEHLNWLVRYQVLGESQGTISRRHNRSPRAVATGIRAAAKYVGVTIRSPSKGGRPRRLRSPKAVSICT